VHGIDPDEVHFHEVGALDSLVDVVAACWGLHDLGLATLTVSPVALGGGTARVAHGELPVPLPAVLELLRDSQVTGYGGPVDVELCTPTGAALVAEWADHCGPMPPLSVVAVGAGAGQRDLPGRANVVRLVVGDTTGAASAHSTAVVVEANVDDLDPRLWPNVLARLLEAGADDAWLTPVLMKKGRPAHTVHVLVRPDLVDAAAAVLFAETSTIGLRQTAVAKRALDREITTVVVDGRTVRVKLARVDGRVVNAAPEYDDVAAAAAELGRPVKVVLAAAAAEAHRLLSGGSG
jgi:uncharacterized protein (TIGR00299 family) protein